MGGDTRVPGFRRWVLHETVCLFMAGGLMDDVYVRPRVSVKCMVENQ